VPPQGGEAVVALEGGGPLTSFFLGSSWYYRGALPLGDDSQGGGKFAAMGGASKNRVFGQYIVLKASPGPHI
jgi:hypothetical protein